MWSTSWKRHGQTNKHEVLWTRLDRNMNAKITQWESSTRLSMPIVWCWSRSMCLVPKAWIFVRSVFRLLQQTMQPEGVKDMGTFYSSYGTTSRVFSRITMSRLLVDNQGRLILVGNLPTRMMSSVCAILETVCKSADLWGHNFPVWENRFWIGSKLLLMQF